MNLPEFLGAAEALFQERGLRMPDTAVVRFFCDKYEGQAALLQFRVPVTPEQASELTWVLIERVIGEGGSDAPPDAVSVAFLPA